MQVSGSGSALSKQQVRLLLKAQSAWPVALTEGGLHRPGAIPFRDMERVLAVPGRCSEEAEAPVGEALQAHRRCSGTPIPGPAGSHLTLLTLRIMGTW